MPCYQEWAYAKLTEEVLKNDQMGTKKYLQNQIKIVLGPIIHCNFNEIFYL